ncbi:PIG-L family deacetylase [Candidatus Woesearchaeota archaeon]|nr:PIG-L family deacetylase [Candidatus Woesearchaeota archaeon]
MGAVLVFCAHPDDEVLGVGGTIAKYAEEGVEVVTIIFSTGENSHPWMQKDVTIEMRDKETKKAHQILGLKESINLGLSDRNVKKEAENPEVHQRIIDLINNYSPEKIFTHAIDDPHKDHLNVYKVIKKIIDSINYKGDVYSFEVWNPLNLMKRNLPKMYVDISRTFPLKVKALKCFESQKMSILPLLPAVYTRAITAGFGAKCRFAEVFYKIK